MYGMMEDYIFTAIEYDAIILYLEGVGGMCVHTDPRDLNSPHAYNFSIECYNKFNKKYPEYEMDKKFVEEIIKKLSDESCYYYDVYSIFSCLASQLRLQKNGIASFYVNSEDLKQILNLLKINTLKFQNQLKICKLERGSDYSDGMYGYMMAEDSKIFRETGQKIL